MNDSAKTDATDARLARYVAPRHAVIDAWLSPRGRQANNVTTARASPHHARSLLASLQLVAAMGCTAPTVDDITRHAHV